MIIGIDGNEANTNQRVGSNVYSYQLLKEIYIQDKENDYIVYLREKRVPDLPNERHKFIYRIIPPKKLWTQWRLPLDLYFHKPRPNLFFTPGHYSPRFSPVPGVISILDLGFLYFPDVYTQPALHQLKTWTAYSIKKACHIFAISEHTKQDIVKNYNFDPDNITVTYPGVHHRFRKDYSYSQIQFILEKYHLPQKYLLFVGTRQPRKNLNRLIQAVSQIPDMSLVIVGKTWYQFRNEIDPERSRRANIIELDYVPDEDLPLLMKGTLALVLPSLYEGFGIPVAEAMAIGTPVIVSNVSSLPEIVGNGGILINPNNVDSITAGLRLALSLSDQKRVQLIKSAQQRSLRFTWANCAHKTLEVLHALAAKRQDG